MGLGTTRTASDILRQELARTISIDDDHLYGPTAIFWIEVTSAK
jgi:hypothetical protein